ncbi:hypothetical protein TSUD_19070 [Trifolium subterraneum]|uniref:Retrotransposon gag domain-containing protein n=1 Tax=Trifolium subterraneum TaxID=3900 RepID=A0A2Z6N321_TRISU|nr:hypothetical protein TSUD_19070 [Trifolium subterraneum]
MGGRLEIDGLLFKVLAAKYGIMDDWMDDGSSKASSWWKVIHSIREGNEASGGRWFGENTVQRVGDSVQTLLRKDSWMNRITLKPDPIAGYSVSGAYQVLTRMTSTKLPTKYNIFECECLHNDSILSSVDYAAVEDAHHLFLHCPVFGVLRSKFSADSMTLVPSTLQIWMHDYSRHLNFVKSIVGFVIDIRPFYAINSDAGRPNRDLPLPDSQARGSCRVLFDIHPWSLSTPPRIVEPLHQDNSWQLLLLLFRSYLGSPPYWAAQHSPLGGPLAQRWGQLYKLSLTGEQGTQFIFSTLTLSLFSVSLSVSDLGIGAPAGTSQRRPVLERVQPQVQKRNRTPPRENSVARTNKRGKAAALFEQRPRSPPRRKEILLGGMTQGSRGDDYQNRREDSPRREETPTHSPGWSDDEVYKGPLSRQIMDLELPRALQKPPQLGKYDGLTDPDIHIQNIDAILNYQAVRGGIKCRIFPTTLVEGAMAWYRSLPQGSITSWKDLCKQFTSHFTASRNIRRRKQTWKLSAKDPTRLSDHILRDSTKKLCRLMSLMT